MIQQLRASSSVLLVALLAFSPAPSYGQPPVTPEFEVASMRATPPSMEHGISLGLRMDGSQLRIAALPLRDIIAMAYRVKPYQVIGPEWIGTTTFDINAKLPTDFRSGQMPEMLQALLKVRVGLELHREARELPVYVMVTGRPPLRLVERAPEPDIPGDAVEETLAGNPGGISANFGDGSSYTFVDGKFQGIKMSAPAIAAELARFADRPIQDMTGLKGAYDVSFTVSRDDYMALLARAALNSGMAMPVQMMQQIEGTTSPLPDVTALLGLRLDAKRMPVDVLVIDRALKTPTEN